MMIRLSAPSIPSGAPPASGSLPSPAPALPPAQDLAIDPSKPVSLDVEYWTPVLVNTHLGGTPTDIFNQSSTPVEAPYVPCTPEKCGPLPQEIYRNNPLMDNGSPRMRRMVKRLEDQPKSPVNGATLWGLIGGASAGTIGVLGGAMLGSPILGGVIGTAVGLVAAGGVGAYLNRGDKIRLVWDQYPIYETKYVGYKEEIKPAVQEGQQGYLHHFVPDLRATRVGEYKIPRIEHYRDPK